MVFDVPYLDGTSLMGQRYEQRRAILEEIFASGWARPPLNLCPSTTDTTVARSWLEQWAPDHIEGCAVRRVQGRADYRVIDMFDPSTERREEITASLDRSARVIDGHAHDARQAVQLLLHDDDFTANVDIATTTRSSACTATWRSSTPRASESTASTKKDVCRSLCPTTWTPLCRRLPNRCARAAASARQPGRVHRDWRRNAARMPQYGRSGAGRRRFDPADITTGTYPYALPNGKGE